MENKVKNFDEFVNEQKSNKKVSKFVDANNIPIKDGDIIYNSADRNPYQEVRYVDGDFWFGARGTFDRFPKGDWDKLHKGYGFESFWEIDGKIDEHKSSINENEKINIKGGLTIEVTPSQIFIIENKAKKEVTFSNDKETLIAVSDGLSALLSSRTLKENLWRSIISNEGDILIKRNMDTPDIIEITQVDDTPEDTWDKVSIDIKNIRELITKLEKL